MPQGSVVDKDGKTIWKYDICCEFDCNIEFAESRGAKCDGDFTKRPCIFLGEHEYLNIETEKD